MAIEIKVPIECEAPGCNVIRLRVNHWFVVETTKSGAHIHKWDKCPDAAMANGKHVCGLEHAFKCASNVLTVDNTDPDRESTLVLSPPLTREGTVPVTPAAVEESEKEEVE